MSGLTEEQEELFGKLTPLQKRVCTEVLSGVHKSNRQSYYAAGGKAKTDEAADTAVSQILSNRKVSAFMDSVSKDRVNAAIMTRDEALERLSLIARTKITDVAEFSEDQIGEDEDGEAVIASSWKILNSEKMSDTAAASIKSVTSTKLGNKLEMHDPMAAIQQLSKMQGWDSAQKFEHTSPDGSMTMPTRIELVAVGNDNSKD